MLTAPISVSVIKLKTANQKYENSTFLGKISAFGGEKKKNTVISSHNDSIHC